MWEESIFSLEEWLQNSWKGYLKAEENSGSGRGRQGGEGAEGAEEAEGAEGEKTDFFVV